MEHRFVMWDKSFLDKSRSYKSKARDIRRLLSKIGENDPRAEGLKKQMEEYELFVPFFPCLWFVVFRVEKSQTDDGKSVKRQASIL